MPDEGRSAAAYNWTVAAFYVFAIGANAWILWKTYGDNPEVQIARRKAEGWWERAIRPIRERLQFRSAARHVQFEAYSTVVDADPTWAHDKSDGD